MSPPSPVPLTGPIGAQLGDVPPQDGSEDTALQAALCAAQRPHEGHIAHQLSDSTMVAVRCQGIPCCPLPAPCPPPCQYLLRPSSTMGRMAASSSSRATQSLARPM